MAKRTAKKTRAPKRKSLSGKKMKKVRGGGGIFPGESPDHGSVVPS